MPDCVVKTQHQGFGRQYRLTHSKDFQRVFDDNRSIKKDGFLILARENTCNHPRLGMVVSRKCSAKAVVRNKLKRHSREIFRQLMHELPPHDIVIIMQRRAAILDASLLRIRLKESLLTL